MAKALNPTAGINLYVVQVPQQRTRRPPFQLFIVNTPEIVQVVVRRCQAAESGAVDLEHHANVQTMMATLKYDPKWAKAKPRPPVFPADDSRLAIADSAFGSSIQLCVRQSVQLVRGDPCLQVVTSVFYVPLGDAFQQRWKVHVLRGALATPKDKKSIAGLKIPDWPDDNGSMVKRIHRIKREMSTRLLFLGGVADLDVIWKTVSQLHTHLQKSLRLAEPGEHMRNILQKEQHMRVEPAPFDPPARASKVDKFAKVDMFTKRAAAASKKSSIAAVARTTVRTADLVLANPRHTQIAAIQSQRAVSLNGMFRACEMPENPLKRAPCRKYAFTHMRKCINAIKHDIKQRVDDN
ncbi:hypothetical protein AMAG_18962 [Allomyces macrogynus ATCC 38327]|uniref:Uncharacterized protein n=1 Tax=Allomyces macrogynus (strain ATCC 38327) TaxID=578462 RepID=A0A0L0SKS8_ALLM3|nr:hypothetical protein AMAG_18962 [Allomyces macrogynus ATCC 38327]|eukprot:KNE63171.1 hypothetical protein AMAG_18962 [Allomyces macrogynus ATCC 38327]